MNEIIKTKFYVSETGAFSIVDPELIGVTILRVCREGVGYNIKVGTPGTREYKFTITTGEVLFQEPFIIIDVGPYDKRERVMVRYRSY